MDIVLLIDFFVSFFFNLTLGFFGRGPSSQPNPLLTLLPLLKTLPPRTLFFFVVISYHFWNEVPYRGLGAEKLSAGG